LAFVRLPEQSRTRREIDEDRASAFAYRVRDARIQQYLPKPRFPNEAEPMAAEGKWKLATTVCLQPDVQAVAQALQMAGYRRRKNRRCKCWFSGVQRRSP